MASTKSDGSGGTYIHRKANEQFERLLVPLLLAVVAYFAKSAVDDLRQVRNDVGEMKLELTKQGDQIEHVKVQSSDHATRLSSVEARIAKEAAAK